MGAVARGQQGSHPRRAQDSAIVKPMSSALINRMVHVQLKASHRDWLEWAGRNAIHPLAKALLKDLAAINLEIAQMVVATVDDQPALPSWFLVEVVRDLPRLVERKSP